MSDDSAWATKLLHVLCCGGRTYNNMPRVTRALDKLRAKNAGKRLLIIEGGATGADTLCGRYADLNELPHLRMPAEWGKLGKRIAGPVRNRQMADILPVDCVVAFPGGSGTADMVAEARKRGIKVYEVQDD
jgi:predicted Rossmann-fold nucleotide-binding protein